jgi:hypothetical protein
MRSVYIYFIHLLFLRINIFYTNFLFVDLNEYFFFLKTVKILTP